MAPIRGLNLKKLFGTLTPYVDDVARGVSNYGDDALRLASNYGDDALDYGVDIASAVNRYDDDVARAFNSNVDVMKLTPRNEAMSWMYGDPPPIKSTWAPSAEDQAWLTRDLLNRGVLNEGTHYGDDVSQLVASFGDDYLNLPVNVDPDTMSKIIKTKRVPHDRLSEMYEDLHGYLRRAEQDYRYTSGESGLPRDDLYTILRMLSPYKPVEELPF